MSKHWALSRPSALACGALLFCLGAYGQGTTPTQTLDKFSHEMTLPLANIGFSGTLDIPLSVLQSVQGGALEVRQSVEYIRATSLLRIRHFLVAPQSPNPTPETAQTQVFDDYLVSVRNIAIYDNPRSIVIQGAVEQLNTSSPFGRNLTGQPVIYSAGFTPQAGTGTGTAAGTATQLNDVTLVMPGRLATYGQRSAGTVSFLTAGAGPGTPATGPKADAGADITTAQSEITLDASRSTHSDNDALTYRWRVLQGSANILDPASIRPRVQLAQNFGTYVFELTVTDTKGATSTDTVSVNYSGRF